MTACRTEGIFGISPAYKNPLIAEQRLPTEQCPNNHGLKKVPINPSQFSLKKAFFLHHERNTCEKINPPEVQMLPPPLGFEGQLTPIPAKRSLKTIYSNVCAKFGIFMCLWHSVCSVCIFPKNESRSWSWVDLCMLHSIGSVCPLFTQ